MSIYTCERCMHGFTHASDFLHHRAICVGVLTPPGAEGTWLPTPLHSAPHWAGVDKVGSKQSPKSEPINFQQIAKSEAINFQQIAKSEAINFQQIAKSEAINFQQIAKSVNITQPNNLIKPKVNPTTSKEGKAKCRYCDKEFESAYIQEHEATHVIGSPEKPYSCEYCGRSFTDLNACRNHERIHTDPRPFVCNLCSKGFMTAGTLKTHLQTHTGEKPFQCTSCDKAFTTAGNLRTHEGTHKGERPFVCLECGKTFSTAGNLKTHEKIHSGLKLYHCTICMKAFSTAGNLKSHEKTHTGEKPFECNQCHKLFSTAGNLKTHYRLHTGERPYVCDICSQAYHSSVHLRSHQKAVHGIEVSSGRGRPRSTSLTSPVPSTNSSPSYATMTNVSLPPSVMTPGIITSTQQWTGNRFADFKPLTSLQLMPKNLSNPPPRNNDFDSLAKEPLKGSAGPSVFPPQISPK